MAGSVTQVQCYHKESICQFPPSARRRYAVVHTHVLIMFAGRQSTSAQINTESRAVCHKGTCKEFCILHL